MSDGLLSWVSDPVTLTLIAVLLGLMFGVMELLLRSLPRIGNVRFQGILEENPDLIGPAQGVHVSWLIDVIRWLQLLCLACAWLVIFRLFGTDNWHGLVVAAAVPAALVVIVRLVFDHLGEGAIASLLRVLRPLAGPLLPLAAHRHGEMANQAAEDDEEEASDAEIQAYLQAGEAAGIFEGDEGEIVESLVDFFDTVVREVMTPRTEMIAVPDSVGFRELLRTFSETHKSRIPVYHETVDRITGVVHVKNLVRHTLAGDDPPVSELAKPCMVVPESKPLGALLRDFQNEHQQLAIVVDEYGGTSGLVTLEDILEEIVGEIGDELDPREPPEWQPVSPGVYWMQGRAPIEVLDELFGLEVDDEDVDTVGGLVFSLHGTVPEPGTEVRDEPHRLVFTVEAMDERRVESLVVRRLDEEARNDLPAEEARD
jgi:CBS domain containing-hemolysin-like protein